MFVKLHLATLAQWCSDLALRESALESSAQAAPQNLLQLKLLRGPAGAGLQRLLGDST